MVLGFEKLMEEHVWQQWLIRGNDCFQKQQWSDAECYYRQAYKLLHLYCQECPDNEELLMAWLCSCHNLSTLYECHNNIGLAFKFLKIANEYLEHLLTADEVCSNTMLIALKANNLNQTAILNFMEKHPTCEECCIKLSASDTQQPSRYTH